MKPGTYAVFDPRLNRDYRLLGIQQDNGTDQEFSTIDRSIFAIHGARIQWSDLAIELDGLLNAVGPTRFVVFIPWAPGTRSKVTIFRELFDARPSDFVQVAVGDFGTDFSARLLSLRSGLGGETAGVWVLGAAGKEEELLSAINALKLVDTPTSMLAASLTRIAPVTLALDEGWISNLFVSLAPNLLSPIAALLQGFERTANVFVKEAEW